MNQYPVNLNLHGRKVLVVGGGGVACRKLRDLMAARAEITLVSPKVNEEIVGLLEEGTLRYEPREFRAEDVGGCFLVIAATGDDAVNAEVSRHALGVNALVNVVDNAELSSFTLPAKVRRGDLLLTASTGGALPAFSRAIRDRLELSFGEEYAAYLELVGELRPVIKRRVADPRRRKEIFTQLADFRLVDLLTEDSNLFRQKIGEILSESLTDHVSSLIESTAR